MHKFKILLSTVALCVLVSGCAQKSSTNLPQKKLTQKEIEEIVLSDDCCFDSEIPIDLLASIDRKTGKGTGGDCSGFISVLNDRNGGIYFNNKELNKHIPSSGRKSHGMYNLYASSNAISYNNPKPGDLVFFYNTTRSTKKSKSKQITHVGVVRDVYKDGRISFVHNTRGKNKVDYMNLNKKNTFMTGKKVQNSYIVSCKRGDNSCLASNKFAGFGKI